MMRAERHHVSLMLRLCSLTVYKARRLRHEHEADMSNRLANREHAEHAYLTSQNSQLHSG